MKRKEVVLLSLAIFLLAFAAATFALTLYFHLEIEKKITGNAASTSVGIIAFVVIGENQMIPLGDAWNFVSFFLQMSDYNITKVLAPIEGEYEYIQEWDPVSNDFKFWSRQGTKDFSYFNKNKSYLIYMNNADNLTVSGGKFENYSIAILPGWETPDYVYEYESNITGSDFYNVSFYYMQKWNLTSQEFLLYSPQFPEPQFNQILPSEGYFILTDGGVIRYIRK